MTPRWLTRMIRRSVASPRAYGMLRSGMLVLQRILRRPDEPDLAFLARLPQATDELILDIGANGGQSAVALSFIRPRSRIVSYEPVSMLWPELDRVGRLLGNRFEFRKYALGTTAGTFDLHVPVSGRLPITTRASISQDAAERSCRELERAIGLPTRMERVAVEVRPGDAEGLAPTAIKIDVEGAEHEVVHGLAETIASSRPVVILERSGSYDACRRFFREAGYDILTHEAESEDNVHLPGLSDRNWIASPPAMTGYLLGSVREA